MNTMKENKETRIYPVKYTAMLCNEHRSYFTGWRFTKFARLTN